MDSLRVTYGETNFNDTGISSLPSYEECFGSFYCHGSALEDLSKLRIIKGTGSFTNSGVQHLDALEFVGGDLYFTNSRVRSAKNLKVVGNLLDCRFSVIEDLSSIEKVGKRILIQDTCKAKSTISKKIAREKIFYSGPNRR